MPKVTFKSHEGDVREVDVAAGRSLMLAATMNGVPGVDADCGGTLSCATCHVYVDPDWVAKLPSKSEMEETMLDFAQGTAPASRLSCQLRVTSDLDGLVVRVPVSQH